MTDAALAPAPPIELPAPQVKPVGRWRARMDETRAIATQLLADAAQGTTIRVTISVTIGAVVAANFVLSSVGLYDFGVRVWGLNPVLACLVPVAVDCGSVAMLGGAYLARNAHWRIRAYMWLVYLIPMFLSVGGNVTHAQQKNLPDAGVFAAGATPIMTSLFLHALVVVRRNTERATLRVGAQRETAQDDAQHAAQEPTQSAAQDDAQAQDAPPRNDAPEPARAAQAQEEPRNAPTRKPAQNPIAQLVAQHATPDASGPAVLEALARAGHDIKLRTVQHHLKQLRKATA